MLVAPPVRTNTLEMPQVIVWFTDSSVSIGYQGQAELAGGTMVLPPLQLQNFAPQHNHFIYKMISSTFIPMYHVPTISHAWQCYAGRQAVVISIQETLKEGTGFAVLRTLRLCYIRVPQGISWDNNTSHTRALHPKDIGSGHLLLLGQIHFQRPTLDIPDYYNNGHDNF